MGTSSLRFHYKCSIWCGGKGRGGGCIHIALTCFPNQRKLQTVCSLCVVDVRFLKEGRQLLVRTSDDWHSVFMDALCLPACLFYISIFGRC